MECMYGDTNKEHLFEDIQKSGCTPEEIIEVATDVIKERKLIEVKYDERVALTEAMYIISRICKNNVCDEHCVFCNDYNNECMFKGYMFPENWDSADITIFADNILKSEKINN